ncbi:sulfurtransferase TusA family protein [Gracilibacillus marinus]|jgi:rhodanese-related sulfurtransferase/TusA-related sulfurtransferase|uniref:Sulfurtransferase TusA family protein n=1 Tax=Gracilibacillus marinus TaxID=630535 RepID=A0ABV8VPN4_9BACI
MNNIQTNMVLDAKGLACPMPIVKTKKAIQELEAGQVIEVQATDKGSKADLAAWAKSSGHHYLGTLEEGEVLKHYLRKATDEETVEKKHPHTVSNEGLAELMNSGGDFTILDVREEAEYAFGHIHGAISIPLGELEDRINEINKDKDVYVVCRTGSRSDLAAQKLQEQGFQHVKNVLPGMSEWQFDIEKND